MAILPIVTGEKTPILRRPAREITKFPASWERLLTDMYETMFKARGVGLAAPQIGKSLRLFVAQLTAGLGRQELFAAFNPAITAQSVETDLDEEGCLSLPGCFAKIPTPHWVELDYQDLTGTKQHRRFTGFNARIIRHETDHLKGMLCIDHLLSPSHEQATAKKAKPNH